jgi:3-deoxy-D-manno-octulosonic-acid transferase
MLNLYETIMGRSGPFLTRLLNRRCRAGKEDPKRLQERMGHASRFRARGKLAWFHAASVGEAQSTLSLIDALLARYPDLHILVTTGTVTSAVLMQQRLPPHAIHQYYPLDHPQWVRAFLNHWHPDFVLWMESEVWPAMLTEIRKRRIPAVLVNARLSERSLSRWRLAKGFITELLSTFTLVLAQTDRDRDNLLSLGARNVVRTDNLKYSATPLPCDPDRLTALQRQLEGRPVWLYASSHEGEEELAARVHARLERRFPDLLTIVVPRHPHRGQQIKENLATHGASLKFRSEHPLPAPGDRLYIADTLGELGLFYRLCPIACIGRSFSADGGGGHNPVEAALLGCAVLHGPQVQNLAEIYREMDEADAALGVKDEDDLAQVLEEWLVDKEKLKIRQQAALRFAREKEQVLDRVMAQLDPLLAVLDSHGEHYGMLACA